MHRSKITIGLLGVLFAELTAWGWLEHNEHARARQLQIDAFRQRQSVKTIIVKPEQSPFRLLVG